MSSRLLTPREVGDYLQVSEATVRSHAQEWGGIRIGKQWRFHADTLDRIAPRPDPSTLPGSCPANDPSTSTTANVSSIGRYDGATPTPRSSANTEHSPLRTRRKTTRRRSEGAFARDFPEYANR
jgi:hypothetical protein